MPKVILDFETRSGLNLSICGKQRYLHNPLADIICMGYKMDDSPVQLWVPGNVIPDFNGIKIYAFNAAFDYEVWRILGPKYGFPPVPITMWVDVMALCGRFTFHQSLAQAGEDLNVSIKKNARGKALMKLICEPPFRYSHLDLIEFHEYCKTDVESTYEVLNALPRKTLSPSEQCAWELTYETNMNGLPIDVPAVKQILKVTDIYKEEQSRLLPTLTNGVVTKATQTKRIVTWLRNKGVITPNLQAETVEKLLARLDLDPDVRLILQLRQELGRSSTAKYLKLTQMVYKGRIYDNERYYGANTGRWSGMGFQIHNLPRSKVTDASPIIDKFHDLSIIDDDPIAAAKSIIRGMILAPKGYKICAVDYSSIEYIGLCWATNDSEAVDKFDKGVDQYVDMAAYLYNLPHEDIDDVKRYFGKQLVLGCGYGLGGKGFQEYAEAHGIFITEAESISAVKVYRQKYSKVVRMWYDCKDAAVNAITYPKHEFTVNRSNFKVVKDHTETKWLQLTLPSGRALYYNKPSISEGVYGMEVSAMGINPYSKKWERLRIIPGRFVENIIQALSRDILLNGKLQLQKAGYKIIGSVHDEIILETPEEPNCLEDIKRLMCSKLPWALDLPLRAEGFFENRYRKM